MKHEKFQQWGFSKANETISHHNYRHIHSLMKQLMELKPDGTRRSETDGQIGEHSRGKIEGSRMF